MQRWPARCCICGSTVRHQSHALSSDVIVRAIRPVDVHAEPSHRLRGDGKRRTEPTSTLVNVKKNVNNMLNIRLYNYARIYLLRRTSTCLLQWQQEGREHLLTHALHVRRTFILVGIRIHSQPSRSINNLGAWGSCALDACADFEKHIARHARDARKIAYLTSIG